ncbi:MAG: G protein-coupled receptor LGR4 [Planctomycetota bacterium]
MKLHTCFVLLVVVSCFDRWNSVIAAPPAGLANVKTRADLDAVIASTPEAELKKALQDHADAILAAAERRVHVEAVLKAIEISPGKVEKINTTPESFKKVVGGDVVLFDTLKLVDLAMPNAGPHDHRKVDPYDAAFFQHLGHIQSLETLNIIATKLNDDWIAPLGQLTRLKSLRFTNNGKLTDAGLEQLAGLKNLETFSFVGTGMKGHAYSKFHGWTRLIKVSHRGSSIDDEGLQQLCEHLVNLESISLAHAKFTDAGAVHLAKLTRLKGLEIGSQNATPSCLKSISALPLEYLQIGDGLDKPEGIKLIKDIPTLRRLTLTNAKELTDADLKVVAGITQLEHLELGRIDLPDERLDQLKNFAFLKSMRLVPAAVPFSPETQARIKLLLPKLEIQFK